MADEMSLVEWAFKGTVGLVLTTGGALWWRLTGKVDEIAKDLSKHEVEVARDYARNDSLIRIHDRIDDMATDIKTLIGKVR